MNTMTMYATGYPETLTLSGPQVQAIVEEYDRQTGVIGAERAKNSYASRQIARLYQEGALTAHETFSFLVVLDDTVAWGDDFHVSLWRQFIRGLLEDLLNDMRNAVRLGARNIAIEIDRSLYVLPPSRRGLLWRLLFGEQ